MVRGMKTLGEKVSRVPNAASADGGRRRHELGQRRVNQVVAADHAPRTRLRGSVVGRHRRHLTGSGLASDSRAGERPGRQNPLAAMTGALSGEPDMSPWKAASPKERTVPLAEATQ